MAAGPEDMQRLPRDAGGRNINSIGEEGPYVEHRGPPVQRIRKSADFVHGRCYRPRTIQWRGPGAPGDCPADPRPRLFDRQRRAARHQSIARVHRRARPVGYQRVRPDLRRLPSPWRSDRRPARAEARVDRRPRRLRARVGGRGAGSGPRTARDKPGAAGSGRRVPVSRHARVGEFDLRGGSRANARHRRVGAPPARAASRSASLRAACSRDCSGGGPSSS
jgi:hypothetical protein